MAVCDPEVHRRYRPLADEDEPIAGALPELRIRGSVLYKVHRGPYSGLGAAWGDFFRRFHDQREWVVAGPPGDVYVCSPAAHQADGFREVLTVLYVPVRRARGRGGATGKAAPKKGARRGAKTGAAPGRKGSGKKGGEKGRKGKTATGKAPRRKARR